MPGLLSGPEIQGDRARSGVRQIGASDIAGQLTPNVSSDEQAAYDEFVDNGRKMIFGPDSHGQVLEALSAADPVMSLANAAALVTSAVEDSARQAGRPLGEDVVYHGGIALLEDLAELAGQAKIHDFADDEMEAALYQGLDLYRAAKESKGGLDRDRYAAELDDAVRTKAIEKAVPRDALKGFEQRMGGP